MKELICEQCGGEIHIERDDSNRLDTLCQNCTDAVRRREDREDI